MRRKRDAIDVSSVKMTTYAVTPHPIVIHLELCVRQLSVSPTVTVDYAQLGAPPAECQVNCCVMKRAAVPVLENATTWYIVPGDEVGLWDGRS